MQVDVTFYAMTFLLLAISTIFFNEIATKTEQHIQYLSDIGLEERAKEIKVNEFQFKQNLSNINLSSFQNHTPIPQEVLDFDPLAKNTIITTDPDVQHNKSDDVKRILDIRLYPVLENLIKEKGIEVFLGTKEEMAAYYLSKESPILLEFIIPSSATYYLTQSCVVMSRLVSEENLIAQLLTLKLAGIEVEGIPIVGEIQHFSKRVEKDIAAIEGIGTGNQILIVAGCGLEKKVTDILAGEFGEILGDPYTFKGDIVSLIHTPFLQPQNGIHGIISLNLNYGEITEKIVTILLEKYHCSHVFTGGAGGYISQDPHKDKPLIGSYIPITQCMNEKDEITGLDVTPHQDIHLQIPSIFLETYDWLKRAKLRGTSVDVETFYIMRAIQNYNVTHPHSKIDASCGYFVSDYVGEKPLREYSKVYSQYDGVLSKFMHHCLQLPEPL